MADPAFSDEPFRVHTRWIETEFDNTIAPYAGGGAEPTEAVDRERIVVEVGGRRLEVSLPAGLGAAASAVASRAKPPAHRAASRGAVATGDGLASPMQGTIVKIAVTEGQQVSVGELVVVLEAMKMEQPVNAHRTGIVTNLAAEVGATVTSGAVICEIKD